MSTPLVGLIPAAGLGTRISPLPSSKELFPIGFRTVHDRHGSRLLPKVVSQYLLDTMRTAGARKVIFVLGRGKSDIMEYYGSGAAFGVHATYLLDDNLRGMPHSMNLAWPWIRESTVLFGMPDTIFAPHDAFVQMLAFHQRHDADVTLGVFPTDRPEKLCVVRLDEDGNVVYMEDKPTQTDLRTTWGCGCWSPKFSAFMHEYLAAHPTAANGAKETVLADVFLAAMEQGMRVTGVYFQDGEYIDIGTPERLTMAVQRFSERDVTSM